ncbi:hypothetical protein [Nocardioides sp. SYSU D00065]|uniref:hypothetical protein n=1 Tax=Nocardioides sp. SYSU D00065 TaxID=2817378 RepID=UPI001B3347A8|nr:hypothetical protein [Nocardioides sp. SYSU D00065]
MSEALGVEVGRVWRAGAKKLPEVGDTLETAKRGVSTSLVDLLSRSSGVGTDVSSRFDELRGLISRALEDSEQAIRDCGTALVWAAEDYELTDQAARDAYEREKQRID